MRRTTFVGLVGATALVLCATACKRNQTVAPEEDSWVPDETLEPQAATPDPAPELSEEERLDRAKGLYMEAEGKAGEKDWVTAVGLYEQAYHLVPAKHGFALKVAIAAEKAGDCAKAITYFEHFVQYAEADKYEDDLAAAKKSLAALNKQGC